MPTPRETTDSLARLHDDYVYQVNSAVAEGRDDLVAKLVRTYEDEALRIVSTSTSERYAA